MYSRKSLIRTLVIRTHWSSEHFYQSHTQKLFPATFIDGKLALAVQMVDVECFSARCSLATHCMAADNFYGKGRLLNKGKSNCQSQPLGTVLLQRWRLLSQTLQSSLHCHWPNHPNSSLLKCTWMFHESDLHLCNRTVHGLQPERMAVWDLD